MVRMRGVENGRRTVSRTVTQNALAAGRRLWTQHLPVWASTNERTSSPQQMPRRAGGESAGAGSGAGLWLDHGWMGGVGSGLRESAGVDREPRIGQTISCALSPANGKRKVSLCHPLECDAG